MISGRTGSEYVSSSVIFSDQLLDADSQLGPPHHRVRWELDARLCKLHMTSQVEVESVFMSAVWTGSSHKFIVLWMSVATKVDTFTDKKQWTMIDTCALIGRSICVHLGHLHLSGRQILVEQSMQTFSGKKCTTVNVWALSPGGILTAVILLVIQEERWHDGIMFYVLGRGMDRHAYADKQDVWGGASQECEHGIQRELKLQYQFILPPQSYQGHNTPENQGQMDYMAVVCSLDREEFSTMLTTTSPCSCVLFKDCLCNRHLFCGLEWREGWSIMGWS